MNEIRRLELLLMMRKNDLSAPDVAQMLGVRPQTVRCWISGVRTTPDGTHKRVRDHLKARRRAPPSAAA